MNLSDRVLFVFVAVSFGGTGHAAEVADTSIETTEAVYTEEALAKAWRLSVEEWQQYRSVMEGPRGIWSPSLDPITVLGIHAQTEAERRRYAELLVMIEFERVEQELLFQRAYDEAAGRLFPSLPRVAVAADQEALSLAPSADRIAFFGSIDPKRCPACERELTRLLQAPRGLGAPALDLFLADAADDATIRAWARTRGVGADQVRAKRVTLNHARDSVFVPKGEALIKPRVMQRLAGQWRPVIGPR